MDKPKYKRVLLKLSGEALAGDRGIGINNEVVNEIAVAIKKVREIGVEVACKSTRLVEAHQWKQFTKSIWHFP